MINKKKSKPQQNNKYMERYHAFLIKIHNKNCGACFLFSFFLKLFKHQQNMFMYCTLLFNVEYFNNNIVKMCLKVNLQSLPK